MHLRCERQERIDHVFVLVILCHIFLWQVIISQKCKNPASSELEIINQISMDIDSRKNILIMKAGKIDKASQMSIFITIDYTGSQVRHYYANSSRPTQNQKVYQWHRRRFLEFLIFG